MERFWNNLLIRSRTALFLVPITIAFIIVGRIFLVIFITVIIFLALQELTDLIRRQNENLSPFPVLIPPLPMPILIYLGLPFFSIIIVLVIVILITQVLQSELDEFQRSTSLSIFSLIYLGLLPSTVIPLRGFGVFYCLVPFLITWINDTGAYLFGSFFGRKKLSVRLSPRKTWEGTLAGILTSIGAIHLLAIVFPLGFSLIKLWVIGFTLPIISLFGDLFESGLKREVGMKDTSAFLPGHGGVLDRIDSLLFVIPYFYLLMTL